MHLKTFSRDKWLSSKYFYENLIERIDFSTDEGRTKLEDFQRILAITINEIKADQHIYNEFCIVTSGLGYKIATCDEDYAEGQKFIYKKIKTTLAEIKFIEEMHKKFLKVKPEEKDLFMAEKAI
jgi:hypothetical protein